MPELPAPIDLSGIVTEVLQESGVLPPRQKFTNALENNGVTIESLAQVLAYLILSGKESTKLRALQLALSSYGIEIQPRLQESSQQVTVNINVNGNLQQNQLFAPERKY